MSEKNESLIELIIQQSELLSSVGCVIGAADKRGIVPILSNIRIDALEDESIFTASNTDITIRVSVKASVMKKGSITVNAFNFWDAVRKVRGKVKIIGGNEECTIKAGSCKFKFPCLPITQFPSLEECESSYGFSVPGYTMLRLMEKTVFAIPSDNIRYNLSGCLLRIKKNNLDCVATNGHRLAYASCVSNAINDIVDIEVILPKRTVGELMKIISVDSKLEIDVGKDDSINRIKFVFQNITIVSKLIAAKFPDYEKVIPRKNSNILKVKVDLLIESVERVSIIYSDKSKAIRFILANNIAKLFSNMPDNSSVEEDLEVEYHGIELEIGFNYSYLLDCLKKIESDIVVIEIDTPKSAVVIKDFESKDYFFIIMPMVL